MPKYGKIRGAIRWYSRLPNLRKPIFAPIYSRLLTWVNTVYRGSGGRYSRYFAGGFALRRCRNSIRRYSAAPKCEFRSQFLLLPLDGFGSAVPSFQLHPVFGAVSNRVPPGNAMSCFVGLGDKSWDNSKNFFQTQDVEFLFLSQRPRRDAFASSISPKTPVLKLNRPFARKPPATIASESTRAAFMLVEKPQVAALRRPRVK